MRFMIMVKANATSEAGVVPGPDDKLMMAMTAYHEALAKAGVLLDATGLQPSSKGARVTFKNGKLVKGNPAPLPKDASTAPKDAPKSLPPAADSATSAAD